MRLFIASLVLSSVLVLSCGKNGGGNNPPPPVTGEKVKVYLFAAHWCGPCKKEIFAVRDAFKNDPNAARVLFSIFTASGDQPDHEPSDADAAAFKAEMGINATMVLDPHCQIYKSYFRTSDDPNPQCAIPASAVLREDKTVLMLFRADNSDPASRAAALIDFIRSRLK
jgi:peroxiredoxin